MDAPEGFRAVRHAGIVRFIPDSPQRVEMPVRVGARTSRKNRTPGACRDCGRRVWRRSIRCLPCHHAHVGVIAAERRSVKQSQLELHHILERNLAKGRWIICDCGCLIAPHELCPSCVIPWMRANEHVPEVIYFHPATSEERRAA